MPTIVAFDLETYAIQPGNLTPKPVVSSWASEAGSDLVLPDRAAERLRTLLVEPGTILVGANVSFDLGVVVTHYPDLMPLVFEAYHAGRIHDVQIIQQLIDVRNGCLGKHRLDGSRGYSLADLEAHWIGRSRHDEKQDPDSWRLRYAELSDVSLDQWPAAASKYALDDAEGTLRVYLAQRAKYGHLASEEEQFRAMWALHLMSIRGLVTDPAAVTALEARLTAERAANLQTLIDSKVLKPVALTGEEKREGRVPECWIARKRDTKGEGPRPARWGKDMALIKSLVDDAYKGRAPRTEGGDTSTSKDTLEASGHPILEILGDASGVEKLLSTYIPVLKRGDTTPIQARYNVLLNNGRTSCREPNIQQLPRAPGVRECFVARPGYVFTSVDLDGGELRSLAQVQLNLFGTSTLADEIAAGIDPLLSLAAQILNITYEEAKGRKGEPEIKEARQFAKVYHYGKAGGLGIQSTIEYAWTNLRLRMAEAQVRQYDRVWFRAYPEMRKYFDHVARLVGEGDAVVTSFGSGMLRGGAGYTDTCNHLFSSLTAQGAKDACFYVAWECYVDRGTALYGTFPVAFLHDELFAEVPEDRIHEASYRLAEVMVAEVQRRMPDVKVTASPAAARRWSKAMEARFDDAGKLVPWAPAEAAQPLQSGS